MYDAIIIGCGPAGMAAGIYLARAGKKVKIFEKETIGGQMASSPLIENYLGYNQISGNELAMKMYNQVISSSVEVDFEEVTSIEKNKVITTTKNYLTKVIIVATGAEYRRLGLENEEKLIGKGIHFCASCDGTLYKDRVVAIIGGGNTAAVNALYLSSICQKVYLIHNKKELTCENILNKRILENKKINHIPNSTITSIKGQDELKSIIIKDIKGQREILVDGLFISIGMKAKTDIFKDFLEISEDGYLIHDHTKSKYDNIFVIGDCIQKDIRQIATAINDGVISAIRAIDYLNKESR